MYRDQEPFKVGDAVFHTDYNPEIYYGVGIITEITHRGAFGKPRRVRVMWSKHHHRQGGNCGVHCLKHAGL